jgi:hypothetical protein
LESRMFIPSRRNFDGMLDAFLLFIPAKDRIFDQYRGSSIQYH